MSQSLQIFQDACTELGELLKAKGFKYLKSKRQARRQGKLFEHIISFNSSARINSIPGNVHLEVKAMARSDQLERYRQAVGITLGINESYLWETTIANIFHPAPPYIRYDIGDPQTRRQVIEGIKQILTGDVLHAFDLIESPSDLQKTIEANLLPCLSEEAIRDYLGCFQDTPRIERADMRESLKQKIIEVFDRKIEQKGENVGLSFYAFFANKNDDPQLLMEAAEWWIMTNKLDHFEKAVKIKRMVEELD